MHYWEAAPGSKWELSTVLRPDEMDFPNRTYRAWADVAQHLFPRHETNNDRLDGWFVRYEPFSENESDEERHTRDAIVVKAFRTNVTQQPQQLKQVCYIYSLIIETKPPSRDTPEGWAELLAQVCSRECRRDKGSHDVYIICAVGIKYMSFYWDPSNAGNPAQELRLSVAGKDVHFPSQLKPAPDCSPHVPGLNADDTPDQYRIDLSRVWSADPAQLDAAGQAMEPLTALESFLTNVRTTPLHNPYTETELYPIPAPPEPAL